MVNEQNPSPFGVFEHGGIVEATPLGPVRIDEVGAVDDFEEEQHYPDTPQATTAHQHDFFFDTDRATRGALPLIYEPLA